jgi:hypothetical protein
MVDHFWNMMGLGATTDPGPKIEVPGVKEDFFFPKNIQVVDWILLRRTKVESSLNMRLA